VISKVHPMNTPSDARAYAPILHSELPYPLLFAGIGGAHMFGFPSPDSDVDLRACHILPTASFISLDEPRLTVNRIWPVDGVEVDLVSHDLKKFVTLLLRQSGNHLEQLFSPWVVVNSDWAAELRAIMRGGGIARHVYHAYAGYSKNKWQEWRKEAMQDGAGRIKALLYAYRVSLTGIHVLRTGEVNADLSVLAPVYGLVNLLDLIAAKTAERIAVPLVIEEHDSMLLSLQQQLQDAFETSPLPEMPTNRAALDDFIVRVRLACA
jgi:predicted nucleotidyltransferase